MHDFEPGYETYAEKPGYSWDADIAFADVNPSDYVALVIPGGRAPEYIRNDSACQKIVRYFFGERETRRSVLPCWTRTDRTWSAEAGEMLRPALEPDIKAAGAEFVNSEAVVDGAMVSAGAWPDKPAWMREFVRLFHI